MHEILGTSPIAPLAFGNQAPDSGNSEILALAGTPEQKERYLHPLLAGDLRSAFSMTEPDTAGSDPTLLQTRAVRDGDDWVINGHKWFSSNGSIADFLIVMAVTDPDARPHQRASMFIVDADTPGRQRSSATSRRWSTRRTASAATATTPRSSTRTSGWPAEALLGPQGAGLPDRPAAAVPGPDPPLHALARGGAPRVRHAVRALAVSLRRTARTLSDHQTVQNWIADSEAEMQAARLMTLHAAWMMDTEGVAAARKEIAMIKFYGAKVLHDVVDRAIQAHGALGYSTDLPLEAMYRFARAARIYDGPDEVHRSSVARQVLRGYEAPADGVPSEHVPTRREAARAQFAELLETITAND